MKTLNCKIVFLLLCFIFHYELSTADESCCGDWLSFKDEKCFKLVDDTLRTYDEAVKSCATLDGEPSLPIIHSQEEQNFLSNYCFKTLEKVENFWIGRKVTNNTVKWIDNSGLSYINWGAKGPRSKENYCVQMQSDDAMAGSWLDGPCEKKNLVVCQKVQTWSLARLQNAFVDERKQQEDRLKKLEQNPVPLGFIYVQLPNQPEPKSFWPTVEWKVISSEYSGHFFRVEGGNALAFGQSQSDAFQGHLHSFNYNQERNFKSGIEYTAMFISQGAYNMIENTQNSISDGINGEPRTANETRPINYSVRIWKRIAKSKMSYLASAGSFLKLL